jgi:hypothetical protein
MKKFYNIDDMISMFGWRIKSAVYINDDGDKGLDSKKLFKLIKSWKFWNSDIRKAYKQYQGLIICPYIIKQCEPIEIYGIDEETIRKEKIRKERINKLNKIDE